MPQINLTLAHSVVWRLAAKAREMRLYSDQLIDEVCDEMLNGIPTTEAEVEAEEGKQKLVDCVFARAWTKGRLDFVEAWQMTNLGFDIIVGLAQELSITTDEVIDRIDAGTIGRAELNLLRMPKHKQSKRLPESVTGIWIKDAEV